MKKLNLSFCEDLVYSDFFLILNNRNSKYRSIEKVVNWNGEKLFSLDVFNLYSELKRMIRLLEFLSIKKNKKEKLIVAAEESEDVFLLMAYLKKYFRSYNILISDLTRIEDIQKFDTLKIGLISFFSHTERLERNLNYNKIFLISVIDLDDRIRKEASIYRIYNKLDSFKKSLFFIALLESVLKFHTIQNAKI